MSRRAPPPARPRRPADRRDPAGEDRAAFRAAAGAAPEAMARFDAYEALLRRWSRAINLVSAASLERVWRRHFLDSAQILPLLPGRGPVLDIGSGAGFPGLVLAILGAPDVRLVESDGRKCAFLREAARATGAPATILESRVEDLPPDAFAAVTARACAPLDALVGLARPHLRAGSVCVFPKGRRAAGELTAARNRWIMRARTVPSLSDPEGTLVVVEGAPDERAA